MTWLKADLHTHTAEDPHDSISYSAEMLIEGMARLDFQVLAITCHDRVVYSDRLSDYALARGIVLVPGVERQVEGKHVLLLNPDAAQCAAQTFDELRRLGRRGSAVIAPHPFYPVDHCLRSLLVRNIDIFDAIEYSSVYCMGHGFNRRAVRVARRFGLPLVGASDVHFEPFTDTTFSWIEADHDMASVIDAIHAGRVRVDSRPCSRVRAGRMLWRTAQDMVCGFRGKTIEEIEVR